MTRCLVYGTRFCPDPKLITVNTKADRKYLDKVMAEHANCPPRNWLCSSPPKDPGGMRTDRAQKSRVLELAAEVARLVCVNDAQYVDDPPVHRRLDLAANELGHLLGLPEPEFATVWRHDRSET
jgi:hypothetical protein